MIQVGPVGSNGSGSVAGQVLYNEGFLLLTGSWQVEKDPAITRDYIDNASDLKKSAWVYFGTATGNDGFNGTGTNSPLVSASYSIEFEGTSYIPTLTMLAHAEEGELNYSNNPTFVTFGQLGTKSPATGSHRYVQSSNIKLVNTLSSSYDGHEEQEYERQTFITKIGIYDEHKNLIAVANLATPVKKPEGQGYTFKLKLDF